MAKVWKIIDTETGQPAEDRQPVKRGEAQGLLERELRKQLAAKSPAERRKILRRAVARLEGHEDEPIFGTPLTSAGSAPAAGRRKHAEAKQRRGRDGDASHEVSRLMAKAKDSGDDERTLLEVEHRDGTRRHVG